MYSFTRIGYSSNLLVDAGNGHHADAVKSNIGIPVKEIIIGHIRVLGRPVVHVLSVAVLVVVACGIRRRVRVRICISIVAVVIVAIISIIRVIVIVIVVAVVIVGHVVIIICSNNTSL